MKAKKLNEQQQAVADYLKSQHVEVSFVYVGATKDADGWEHDAWRVKVAGVCGRKFETDYRTGLGHRESTRPMPKDIARLGHNMLARREWVAENVKPVIPCAADVLYSLQTDASCADGNFYDFCDAFGYDSDSRKAERVYDECSKTAVALRGLFTTEQRAALGELLQDY